MSSIRYPNETLFISAYPTKHHPRRKFSRYENRVLDGVPIILSFERAFQIQVLESGLLELPFARQNRVVQQVRDRHRADPARTGADRAGHVPDIGVNITR
jgi:hypothetical protein